METKTCRMLVVSDDGERSVEQALTQLDVDVRLAPSPPEGLDGFDGFDDAQDPASATPLPHAIVLDVREHEEVLVRTFKRHSPLGLVPVLVLLSERTEARVKDLYAAGAALVFLKPEGIAGLRQALERLVSLWCEFVTPPPQPRPLG